MIKGKTYEEVVGVKKALEIKKKLSNYGKTRIGEKNNHWKGEKASLVAQHMWIKDHKPKPKYCEHCKKKSPIDLSNISGKYLRDINDYEWLCRRCHMIYDGRIKPKEPPKTKCKNCNKKTYNNFYCSNNCRHVHEGKQRKHGKLYFCKSCSEFLFKKSFHIDKGKRFGIGEYCKKCVSKKYYIPKRKSTPILDKRKGSVA